MTPGPLRGAVVPKNIGNIGIDTPADNALTGSPLSEVSREQLKLFQISGTLRHMKRELKPREREQIVSALAAGDRIKAKNIYLSATEGNLTDAQNYLKTLSANAELAELEQS